MVPFDSTSESEAMELDVVSMLQTEALSEFRDPEGHEKLKSTRKGQQSGIASS